MNQEKTLPRRELLFCEMKAIYQTRFGGVETLSITEVPKPVIQRPRDLLVQVKAAGMNPVDAKKRAGTLFPGPLPQICGYDASGVVKEVGPQVKNFRVGDEVFFAGDVTRYSGTHAEYTVVDERIVGKKPANLSHAEAAAIPLTGLTAWEALFENARVVENKTLLVIGGAGGAGAMGIQLGSRVAGLKVIATSSRPESNQFCKKMGAHHIINHRNPLQPQLKQLGFSGVDYVFSTGGKPDDYFDQLKEILNPLGHIVFVLPGNKPWDLSSLFEKRGTVSFELMFTRPMMEAEPEKQGEILNNLSQLLDKGTIVTTLTQTLDFQEFAKAHELLDSGKTIGKVVLMIGKSKEFEE